MKLQILIPQYKETDDIIRPLLDSIAIQQNVDFERIGVIICNDGTDVRLSNELFTRYPFEIQYHLEPHRGVSGTRNACFDYATADYVMFCDADDMFFNACGLYIILREIDNGGFDSLVSSFVEETREPGTQKPFYINHDVDSTFVHGKVHKREYLLRENIRWNQKLTIHEDSFFNILCQKLSQDVKFCPTAFYLWKWRDESVCRHDPKYILKTYNNMLDSNSELIREFIGRNRNDLAQEFTTMMVLDAYYTLNKQEWICQENQDYRASVEQRFKEYYKEFGELFKSIDEQKKAGIIVSLRNRFFGEGLLMEHITFDDWISKIKEGAQNATTGNI